MSGTTWQDLAFLAPAVLVGVLLAAWISPSLNALLLGETYAASMGVGVKRIRTVAIVATAVIAGAVTAFCGPIAFLGIAIPHLTRAAMGRADHRLLVPGAVLMGAVVCQLCAVIAQLPGSDGVLPLNVVTAAIGAPSWSSRCCAAGRWRRVRHEPRRTSSSADMSVGYPARRGLSRSERPVLAGVSVRAVGRAGDRAARPERGGQVDAAAVDRRAAAVARPGR